MTANNAGALVGLVRHKDGTYHELGLPLVVDYPAAVEAILGWQTNVEPETSIVMLDQPTIVTNSTGQRPVENLVGSPISRRRGGVQPANVGKKEMFGEGAPIWGFLRQFGGPADPLKTVMGTRVFETYPVLTMIALGWCLPDKERPTGRLPKYNPERRKTFSISDWKYVCQQTVRELEAHGLSQVPKFLAKIAENSLPHKVDQDSLDACICLLVALHLAEGSECMMVGDLKSGYMVIPAGESLRNELRSRCTATGRTPRDWVQTFRARNIAQVSE